ncbi:MAG: tetratricopeptide repeat protein [Candidatus Omnitrophota bacterium]
MKKYILPKFLITLFAVLSVFCFVDLLFAKPQSDEEVYTMQIQAREYREEGLKYQNLGDLIEAKGWYQKAITLDPNYAVAYNDLGVIYEAEGSLDQAEDNYLKAVKIDPVYSSAYANLALFYENKRNLDKAEFYWAKRAGLGSLDDPWTQKAVNRLKDIRLVLYGRPFNDEREEEVIGLTKDVVADKATFDKDDKSLAQVHFQKAKQSFKEDDLATAIKEALDAQYLDQDNKEIEVFIEKAELRALSR